MGPKYEFTGEMMNHNGHLLSRIRRLSDDVLGGWIESGYNLSQEGSCWVGGNAKVYGDVVVQDDAKVYGNAQISGDVWVCDKAQVYDDAEVYNAHIYGNAKVFGNAEVYDHAWVYGGYIYDNAKVYGGYIYDKAKVYGEARVNSGAHVSDNAKVYGNAEISHNASISGNAQVYGNAEVTYNARVYGNAQLHGYAYVSGASGHTVKIYGDIEITSGEYTDGEFSCDADLPKTDESNKVVQDFIYKIDDSNKLKVKTEYSSIDEYFNSSYQNDIKLDTLIIGTIDTKIPLIKLEKIEKDDQLKYKFIVDLTTENEDHFLIQSFIETKEQLSQKLTQTIDALNQYPEFNKYTDDLSNCLCD